MKIFITNDGVYVEAARRCFTVGKGAGRSLVEGESALALYLGVSVKYLPKILKDKKSGTKVVRTATLAEVQAVYGTDVPVFDRTGARRQTTAKPCRVTWRIAGKRHVDFYRSIRATRRAWALDESVFERITHKAPNWQALRPPHLESIEIWNKPLPRGKSFVGVDPGWQEMFDVRVSSAGRVTVVPKQQRWSFASRTAMPAALIELCDWN